MFFFTTLLGTFSTDPWVWLKNGGLDIESVDKLFVKYGYLISGGYLMLKGIGYICCFIAFALALYKLGGDQHRRAEGKREIEKAIITLLVISVSSYFFGIVLSIIVKL